MLNVDFRNPDEIEQDEVKSRVVLDNLGSKLSGKFEEWKTARQEKEDEWIDALRAYNGIYDETTQAKIDEGRSDVFVHLTRTKVQAAYSRIVDLLFQSNDKHWSIEQTPVSEVPEELRAQMAQELMEMLQLGADPGVDGIDGLVEERMQERAENMEREMDDQLSEGGYENIVKQAIGECCILGSGVVKGVTVGVETDQRWGQGAEGWAIQSTEKPVPVLSLVSCFDLYPDPYAISMEDATGCFERHTPTRQQLRDLAKVMKFDEEVLADVLADHAKGNYEELDHERERRQIAGFTSTSVESGRFELLEYWGHVSGMDLESCGCEVEDNTADYHANVWVCGGRTLRGRLTPQRPENLPYKVFPYEKVPHQFWGVGVPVQMKDSQYTLNAAVRSMLDNLAISSGPMYEINMDLIAPGEDPKDLHPWRGFKREGGDPSYPLIRWYQPNNNTANLEKVIDLFRRFMDEETNMPSYTHGQQMPGLNKTASGMSMLMSAANVAVKGIIKNIDDYLIEPIIQSLYDWNMQWNDDESIKGDMQIIARGSTTLVAKEIQSQRLLQFAQMTANPVDAQLTDRQYLLRTIAEAMDIDAHKAVPERDEQELQALNGIGGAGGIAPGGNPGMVPADGLPVQAVGP